MVVSRRGLIRGRGATQRRKTSWAAGPGGTAAGTVSATGSTILGSGITFLVDGLTIVRLRGEMLLYLTAAAASKDGFAGAFGIARFGSAAFLAGVASMETPIDEEDWDGWLYHRYFTVKSPQAFTGAAAADADFATPLAAALRFEVD